ncbi:MAG TPA: FHA domain-containing protein [Ktedonobacterales bacterium]|nr:FHA domain-containing protein [Ktedonobacterales bacterium]
MAYLEIETHDGAHRVNLERDRLTIGRLSYNDVVLPYAQISRQHAELQLVKGQWWITDLHSTNGLQLNSQRIQEHALSSGDQIVLAPGISVRFVVDAASAAQPQPEQLAASSQPGANATSWAERIRQQLARSGGSSSSMTQPTRSTLGPESFVPPDAVAPLRPRSPFADDEVPYVPPAMQPPAPPVNLPNAPNWHPSGIRGNPFAAPPPGASMTPVIPGMPGANGSNGNGTGGYPAPPGPLRTGLGSGDLFLREGPADERKRTTSGPASNLLHVCQTCGQRTAPDSVYCQSCHHSIAHECANCRLSLLPIQERCPRCHTPNAFSVRRSHPRRTDA